jgi:hypothetical protein
VSLEAAPAGGARADAPPPPRPRHPPRCHWCQRLEPAWEAATKAVHEKYPEGGDGRIRYAKVDCTKVGGWGGRPAAAAAHGDGGSGRGGSGMFLWRAAGRQALGSRSRRAPAPLFTPFHAMSDACLTCV